MKRSGSPSQLPPIASTTSITQTTVANEADCGTYLGVVSVVYRATVRCAVLERVEVREMMVRATRSPSRHLIPGPLHVPYDHSMRASRQTELQREFPIHVVCSWLGNSPQVAQQSYLLVTEDYFAKAAGMKKVMVEG